MAGRLPLVPLPLTRARTRAASSANNEARNVRQRVEMPPAPTPAMLATMPPQVVEVLVSQAALAARDEANPPEAICKWMKVFCTLSVAQSCPDDLFRRALAAWGFVPEDATRETVNRDPENPGTYVNLRGQTVAPPGEVAPPLWAGFDSWRAFFAELCEAWYGRRSKPHDDYRPHFAGSMWYDAANRLRRITIGAHEEDVKRVKARFLNPVMSQREKDTLLDSLMRWVEGWVSVVADQEWKEPANREGWGDDSLLDYRDYVLRRKWLEWRNGQRRDLPNPFRNESAPWRAVVALLVLRGGRIVLDDNQLLINLPMQLYERADW